MKQKVEYNTEVTTKMAKDVKDTKQLEAGARERFATGENHTRRHSSSNRRAFGKLGHKGMPK